MWSAALDPGTESRWGAWVLAHTRRAFRTALWLIILFYGAFAPLDLVVTPAPLVGPYWVVRAVVIGASLLCLRVVRAPVFARHATAWSAAYIIAAPVASLAWMVAQLDGPTAIYTGALGTALISLGVALLFLWPPRVVVIVQALAVLPFVVTHFPTGSYDNWPIRVPSAFFVVLAGTVAAIAQVLHWRSRREQIVSQVRVERLEQAERDARRALQAQATELSAANERLRELDRLKTDLIANVSHDLRTPLTLILAALEDLERVVPEDARSAIAMGERNASRLLQLIDDLLALARLDSTNDRVRKVTFDLSSLVGDLVAAFGQGLGHGVRTTGLLAPLVVTGDPHMLASALSNLLANARKFTTRQTPRVEVRVMREGERAVIEVEDDGIGIPTEHLGRIFERFAQVDDGASRRFQGSGIGLAVVREVVAAHGGSVSVTSEVGVGSTFRLELPLASDASDPVPVGSRDIARRLASSVEPAHVDAAPVTAPPPGGWATPLALVVEDSGDMRRTLARILGRELRVRAAADGAQGLEAMRAESIDIVVSDEMMPGMTGSQMLSHMRADPALRDIPVIFVTARNDPDTRLRLLEAGADDLLAKPFHGGELLARARRLVEGRDRARRLQATNRDLDLFASTAAHDLQAPVRTLTGFATHLRRELGPSLQPPALTYLDYIEDGARRLGDLIRGMLALARLSAAPSAERQTPVDLNEVLAEVRRDLTEDLRASGGAVVAAPLPVVLGDRAQLRQLVQNLVSNGLKFRRNEVAPRVDVGARRTKTGWELVFADNGLGFEPVQAERIFEPLTRLHGAGAFPGTGLGLAICRRIVEHHRGSIHADATPGEGARFTVALPGAPSGAV